VLRIFIDSSDCTKPIETGIVPVSQFRSRSLSFGTVNKRKGIPSFGPNQIGRSNHSRTCDFVPRKDPITAIRRTRGVQL